MNLIEQLGGYEAAKAQGEKWGFDDFLNAQLLEYRQQHSIFEVGDKVVWINSIVPNDPRLFEIEETLGEKPDTWSLRHATDEEIAAGKRMGVEKP